MRSHMFSAIAKPNNVEEGQHIPSPPKKSHNISLHTNALDLNLDKNYTLLHPSSQTHNYYIDPTTHYLGDSMFMTFLLYWLLEWRKYPPPYFTNNDVGDIFPML